ncbi:MAG: DUF3021 domain-containing protein [Wujia sp.]
MVKVLERAWNGFGYAVAINLLLYFIVMSITGNLPLVPSYRDYVGNEAFAIMLQLVLVGLMSAVFAGGSVIFDESRVGLLWQSLLYLIITSVVWIPVFGFCFGLFVYRQTMISFSLSYIGTYVICWLVAYRTSRKEVEAINMRLAELRETAAE